MAEDPKYATRVVVLDANGNIVGAIGGGGGGGAVTIADGADVAQGKTTDDAWSGTGAATEIALQKAIAAAAAANTPVNIVLDTTAKGRVAMAASLSVTVATDQPALPVSSTPTASELHLGEVGGNSAVPSATLTRQANATAYASGQALQSSPATVMALACARKNGGTGRIPKVRLAKTGTSITNASFRVHLFRNAPTTLPADAALFTPSGSADFLGSFDVTMDKAYTDGAKGFGVPNAGSYATFAAGASSVNLYALIEARAAYTPVSGEVFTLEIEADRD